MSEHCGNSPIRHGSIAIIYLDETALIVVNPHHNPDALVSFDPLLSTMEGHDNAHQGSAEYLPLALDAFDGDHARF